MILRASFIQTCAASVLVVAATSVVAAQGVKPSAPAPTTAAAAPPVAAAPVAAAPAVEKSDYGKASNWLCRPGRKDACAVDLATTVVAADGKQTREPFRADKNAKVDCFYVYPTVSVDATANSDMIAGDEEKLVISSQLARFAASCRLYAPLYRQVTLTALRAGMTGKPMAADPALAYGDVLAAWNYYLEHDNRGRGVVLIGHSQGSRVLSQLIANEIDGKPVQAKLVSAMLIGWSTAVPKGADVGGTFKNLPLCRSATQTGCIVSYASFRANAPPPPSSRFGHADGGLVAACTNPAALGGGSGALHAYLRSKTVAFTASAPPPPWTKGVDSVPTDFVSVPGLLTGECVQNDKGSYLAVTVHGDPSDPRVDDIVGDVITQGKVQADWGLHLIDVNLVLGDLVDLVKQQTRAYLATAKRPSS